MGVPWVRTNVHKTEIMSNEATSDKAENTSKPSEAPEKPEILQPEPAFGWTSYAEQINGRFAMLGIVLLLLLELFTHQDFFSWLGLR